MQKPILMTTENALKIRQDKKHQTRRTQGLEVVNKSPDDWELVSVFQDGLARFYNKLSGREVACKAKFSYGDVMAIKETHFVNGFWLETDDNHYKFMPYLTYPPQPVYYSDTLPKWVDVQKGYSTKLGWYKRPAMFMFNKDIRTLKLVKEVRCERVQSISENDAKEEGIDLIAGTHQPYDPQTLKYTDISRPINYAYLFSGLWDTINGKKYSWAFNPWVIAYSI